MPETSSTSGAPGTDLPPRVGPAYPGAPGSHPHTLPLQLTSFVGRERAIAEVRGLLAASSR